MASQADSKSSSGYRATNAYGSGGNSYSNTYGSRAQTAQGYGLTHTPADMAMLSHGFQGMNVQNPGLQAPSKHSALSTAAPTYGPVSMAASVPGSLYASPNHYVFPNSYVGSHANQSPGMYTPHASQYMPPLGFQGYQQHDNSPMSQNWTPTTGTNGEVPTLITPRRDSVSSNDNDQPSTPSYAPYSGALTQGGVGINRSPGGVFNHSSSSPTSMMSPYGMQIAKQPDLTDVSPRIKMLVNTEPVIPRAIPAPSSPLKPLDRALENQRGETNVYIRGLLPETTDDMLENWGSRFGEIKSSKSIIDLNTGLCKGFGFVKYHNYEDAENCIRGFHYLGYEVSFARESFYSKLKAFADENNSNLYVSNLPKSMNEHELAQLFVPYNVCSSRILRDKNGHGRGVGFARFDSRESCDDVIKTYNNHTIKSNGEELQIQIRFADTQEQKSLKQQTQAARQFRSAEYEYATQAWRQGRLTYGSSTSQDGNEFEQYLGTAANAPIQSQRWVQSALRQGPGRSPLSNSVAALPSSLPQVKGDSSKDDEATAGAGAATDAKAPVFHPAKAAVASPRPSSSVSDHE